MTKPSAKIEELLTSQALELDALSKDEQRQALKLYRRARGELMQKLEQLDAGTFTARSYTTGLYQIEDGIRFLLKALKQRMTDLLPKMGKLGMKHLEQQANAFAKQHPGSARAPAFKHAWAVEEGKTLLLPQFEASVQRYGQDLIFGMQQKMATALLTRQSVSETQRAIFNDFLKPLGTDDVPIPAYWAERIVRTEAVQTYNTVSLGQIIEGARAEPKLMKRWSAVLEKRTCPMCRQMDGKTIPVRALFELPNGRKVAAPVAHPSCRCLCISWMPGWEA